MKRLIDMYFRNHYGLKNDVEIECEIVQEEAFELTEGEGRAKFQNAAKNPIEILDYESYIGKFKKFAIGRKRCDKLLSDATSGCVILNEITSSVDGLDNLSLPDKIYPGGKFEKVKDQLASSLETLVDVPEIKQHFDQQKVRVCLCSYRLYTGTLPISDPRKTFHRPLVVVAKATGENGAKLSCPSVEKWGFEYRRISYDYAFPLN